MNWIRPCCVLVKEDFPGVNVSSSLNLLLAGLAELVKLQKASLWAVFGETSGGQGTWVPSSGCPNSRVSDLTKIFRKWIGGENNQMGQVHSL